MEDSLRNNTTAATTTCSKFYPKRFFEQGPGQPYLSTYHRDVNQTYIKHDMKWSLLPGRLVVLTRKRNNKAMLTATAAAAATTTSQQSTDSTTTTLQQRHTLTTCSYHKLVFLHLHKCGGSTMNSLVRGHNPKRFHYTIKPWLHFQEARWSTTSFTQRTMHIMTSVATHPDTMMAFSFVRDPVTRFLSGVGQVLVNQDFDPLFPHCRNKGDDVGRVVNATATARVTHDIPSATTVMTNAMLDCVITTIQKERSYLNEHLEPQTFELYRGVRELDIPVLLLPLPYISALVQHAGMNATRRRSVAMEQDGLIQEYWLKRDMLTRSVVSRICELYEMDVRLLQMTRVARTSCPPVSDILS